MQRLDAGVARFVDNVGYLPMESKPERQHSKAAPSLDTLRVYSVTSSITLASTSSSTVTKPTVTGRENLFGPALPGLK